MIWKLIKVLFVLAVLAVIAFVAYAYIGPIFAPGEFAAPQQEIRQPVQINLGE